MLTALDLSIMLLGAVTLALWMFFYLKGLQYKDLFDNLDGSLFPLNEIYTVGYAISEFFKFSYKSKGDRKLRKQLEVLYEPKFADYYLRVIRSQQLTFTVTVFVLSFAFYCLADSAAGLFIGFFFTGVVYYYFGTAVTNKIKKRSDEMLSDFSEVVSKLALLTNAGMILREAWETIAFTGETDLYKEMQKTVGEINNGIAEVDAIYNFGTRCMVPEIKKFSSSIIQGLMKGNSELTASLMDQSKEIWNFKKQNVRRQGEKASSKLLIPICMMFVGILIMVLIPIFTNIGA